MYSTAKHLLFAGLVVTCGVAVFAEDLPVGSRDGVLLLKNGRVLSGEVIPAGDFVVVTVGDDGEVRLPIAQVEFWCRSLDEVYLRRRDALPARTVKLHLELADWCLRNGLLSRASDQVLAASVADPFDSAIRSFERRLQTTAEAQRPEAWKRTSHPPAKTTGHPDDYRSADSALSADQSLELPLGTIEVFTSVIQPLLLNRCGAAHCHGPTSNSKFHLIRPSQGNMVTRRLTERNLYSTIAHIDRQQPDHSLLLTQPVRAHGGNKTPVFTERELAQYQQLAAWVRQLATGQSMLPARIGRREESPADSDSSLPGAIPSTNGEEAASPLAPVNRVRRSERTAARPTRLPETDSSPATDPNPFDPEVFNRRYLPSDSEQR